MRFRSASILVAGLVLSGCASDLGGPAVLGGGGYGPQPYDYAYGGPYAEPGYGPAYGYQPDYAPFPAAPVYVPPLIYTEPGWERRHDRDWRYYKDWHPGPPHVWASQPGGHPVHLASPPGWHPGPPHVWAGQPGGHPVNLAPLPHPMPRPAPPPPRPPDARPR